jgi:hypothetical protein
MKRLLPEVMIAVWAPFATLFTQPVWRHLQVLWRGAVLCGDRARWRPSCG